MTLFLIISLILATLVSEDLTCITAGVLAAQGRISFLLATVACLFGIFIGDLLLFMSGRFFGRAMLKRAPVKWFVSAEKVEQGSQWFERRGMAAIFISRFVPGLRLPTYFAAGLLNTSFWKFTLYFLLAAVVWTPLLVGLSFTLGAEFVRSTLLESQGAWLKVAASSVTLFLLVKLLLQLSSYQGRRKFVGRWRRITRWEFWPPFVFYPPVVCYIIWLSVRHRCLTLFTCVNPAMPGSGFVGESKAEILQGLTRMQQSMGFVARFKLIPPESSHNMRVQSAHEFIAQHDLSFPVVLKPDQGERGAGVAIIKSEEEMAEYLRRATGATIIQEYVAGREFGVFYYRYPKSDKGQLFAITDKRFPTLTGNGTTTLEQLILKDKRAVCMARTYCEQHRERLWTVPAAGEQIQLVELGTHCRGAIFLDGSEIKTAALEEVIDCLSKGYQGFYFGRYDIRTPSLEDFKAGRNFKVVELNGVTSEATNIYDPQSGLLAAYKTLFEQWRIAFEIGAQNHALGVEPMALRALGKLVFDYLQKGNNEAPQVKASNKGATLPKRVAES